MNEIDPAVLYRGVSRGKYEEALAEIANLRDALRSSMRSEIDQRGSKERSPMTDPTRERIAGVVEQHGRCDRPSTGRGDMGYGCKCGFVRTALMGEGTYRLHLADEIIEALWASGALPFSMAPTLHDDPSHAPTGHTEGLTDAQILPLREIPLGMVEIATLLGVKRTTVEQWRHRGIFPDPDLMVSSTPLWWRETVVSWAQKTGRLSAV